MGCNSLIHFGTNLQGGLSTVQAAAVSISIPICMFVVDVPKHECVEQISQCMRQPCSVSRVNCTADIFETDWSLRCASKATDMLHQYVHVCERAFRSAIPGRPHVCLWFIIPRFVCGAAVPHCVSALPARLQSRAKSRHTSPNPFLTFRCDLQVAYYIVACYIIYAFFCVCLSAIHRWAIEVV